LGGNKDVNTSLPILKNLPNRLSCQHHAKLLGDIPDKKTSCSTLCEYTFFFGGIRKFADASVRENTEDTGTKEGYKCQTETATEVYVLIKDLRSDNLHFHVKKNNNQTSYHRYCVTTSTLV